MTTTLALGSGLFWTITYVWIIVVGLRDRTYGMPLVALAANLSWEFIFSFVRPHDGVQRIVDLIWLALDGVILYTVVRFGHREFRWLPRWGFLAMVGGVLVLGYLGVDTVSQQFDAGHATFAAYGQNLMMSGLFLGMLIARRSLHGQSLGIGVAKLVGTALASTMTWLSIPDEPSREGPLLPYLFVAILVLDVAYCVGLWAVRRAQAISA